MTFNHDQDNERICWVANTQEQEALSQDPIRLGPFKTGRAIPSYLEFGWALCTSACSCWFWVHSREREFSTDLLWVPAWDFERLSPLYIWSRIFLSGKKFFLHYFSSLDKETIHKFKVTFWTDCLNWMSWIVFCLFPSSTHIWESKIKMRHAVWGEFIPGLQNSSF